MGAGEFLSQVGGEREVTGEIGCFLPLAISVPLCHELELRLASEISCLGEGDGARQIRD